MRLYNHPLSGNSYKVRLFLALLGLDYDLRNMEWDETGTRSKEFLAINPRGQVPVLQDAGITVWDSQAILAYLACHHGEEWFPLDRQKTAQVMQWLAVSENELMFGLAGARGLKKFGVEVVRNAYGQVDLDMAQKMGRVGLAAMDVQLAKTEWLALDRPTIADVACFPHVALASEGGINLDDYPSIVSWISRIKALPGFIAMEGIALD